MNSFLPSLAISAMVVGAAEIADKTMLATICLALSTGRERSILAISILAFSIASAIAVALSSLLRGLIASRDLLLSISGIIFLILSMQTLTERGSEEEVSIGGKKLMAAFLALFLAEMGDKTQLAVFSLALSMNGIAVILGAILSYSLINALAVYILCRIGVEQRIIRLLSAITMALLGMIMILSALS